MKEDETNRCALCGKEKEGDRKIIVGLHGAVCSHCVQLCVNILATGVTESTWMPPEDASILVRLTRLTRLLADNRFVILGEGNTSAQDGDTLWVKASGQSMKDIDASGLVQVSMQPVLDVLDLYDLSDSELRESLNDARVDPDRDGYPSTETFMHAWLLTLPDVQFVAHTHPTSILAIMCGSRAQEFADNRYFPDQVVMCGPRSVFVKYVSPGLALAQEIRSKCEKYTEETGLQPKTILLQKHGLITMGRTPKEALAATMMMAKAAAVFNAARDPAAMTEEEIAHIHNWTDEHARQAKLWGN